MVKLSDFLRILSFQLEREIINLAKNSLELLEKERNKRLRLEGILKNLGFDDQELLGADKDYLINRKNILDLFNGRKNEILNLVEKFNVDLGGK